MLSSVAQRARAQHSPGLAIVQPSWGEGRMRDVRGDSHTSA